MRKLFAIALLLISAQAFSKSGKDTLTILYNSSWQEIKTGQPAFVGLVWKEGNKWHKQDYYYPQSTLQMDGVYADKDFKAKDGLFTWYHKNGIMSDSCLYIGWQREGTQITWDEEGNQTSINHWHHNIPVDTAIWWNNKGEVTGVQVTDSMGNGFYQQYLADGKTPQVKGFLVGGKRNGRWLFKDKEGILGTEAIYTADSVISVTCYNEKGEPAGQKNCVLEKAATFKGGLNAWKRYLERSLRYPEDAQKQQVQGVVRIQFIIEKDGSVSDVKVLETPNESLGNEGLRMIQQSPKWQPAIQYNRTVIYRHIQSITFALQ